MNSKYKILITGKDEKYFLKNLMKKGILLNEVSFTEKGLILVVEEEDYIKLKEMKTSYTIKVLSVFGKRKYLNIINKYSIFLVCVFIGVFLITILSNIIFKVEVIHTKREIRELVLNDLEEFGIKKYNFKVSFSKKEQIVKQILEKETEKIEWLEIENIGTKYVVKVEERKKNKKVSEYKEQNIIAKKDAMILLIEADTGEIVKKKYDYVQKGDVIISGLIKNKEKIVKKVSAKGIVYGEVWYQVTVELPLNYREEEITNDTTTCLGFYFLNKDFCLFDLKNYKTYKEETTSIVSNKLLPISFGISKRRKTNIIEENYDRKTGTEKAISLAEKKLLGKLSMNDSIISKKALKIVEKDSKIIVDVFFKVKEDITDYANIEDINIEKENEEVE